MSRVLCLRDEAPHYSELSCLDCHGDDEEDVVNKAEQILDFIEVTSFVSLFSGSQNEPLYFVKVTEKGTAEKYLTDPYCHFVGTGEKFIKRYFLKQCAQSKSVRRNFKSYQRQLYLLPMKLLILM